MKGKYGQRGNIDRGIRQKENSRDTRWRGCRNAAVKSNRSVIPLLNAKKDEEHEWNAEMNGGDFVRIPIFVGKLCFDHCELEFNFFR